MRLSYCRRMASITRIEDLADPTFDPYLSDELVFGDVDDPYPCIADLRAQAPVHPADYRAVIGIPVLDGDGAPPHYMVLSYAGVDQILNDPVTFSNRSFEPTLGAAFGHTVSVMDPPEHTRDRRILQQAFRPSVVQEWGADIVAPVVEELVGAFRDAGRGAGRAVRTPVSVHCDLPDAGPAPRGHRYLLQADDRADHHLPRHDERARRIGEARPVLHHHARGAAEPTPGGTS